ncbi:DoxX family membrane protein [Microbispora sp. NBRC 16548]|uniref:DoxX family membrane protein n=1 Tax=Microbispora sp. NBRC 16548 TaxID=3030994 RepID=UPI00160BFAF6|nr:DoxX family membrane protein [Microbispora sp. NBRC 16548]GLX11350.1 membrane protein [Microbispora sp. NBRC 16548]
MAGSGHRGGAAAGHVAEHGAGGAATRPSDYIWALVRISIGWVFLWAFLDKTFGWGFGTPADRAWVGGASPTTGYLKGTARKPLGAVFSPLAGHAWADWLFMLGLLGVGVALILGVGLRLTAVSGGLLLLLMWAAELPPEHNPFMDYRLVYALVIVGLALVNAGDTLGFGRWWGNTALVRRYPFLR